VHLFVVGPPGIGISSVALVLARHFVAAVVDLDILRHVPEEIALPEMDHALGHILLILLPVRLSDLGTDRNSVGVSLVGLPRSRLRMRWRSYRPQHQRDGQQSSDGY